MPERIEELRLTEVQIMAQPITELDSAWVALVDEKLLQMAERQHRMEKRQENLEAAMTMNNTMTGEIYDILSTAKSGFKFLGWIGTGATWVVKLGAFAAASYAAIKLAFPHLFKS
jgi:hypothetical protein